ncbi:hypothetical protein QFW77_18805 [Luteimonas sp. RD2P54]|uniref:Uncharacterized protein n=1 Tax=Luteimonas endophytica TaxID=3042023 RepID=A0ABT6JEJ1_9GAMM|nr:hypothetical protein [Luteimonas endophytica]MDH5825022.1 hypothetical protein [Luteimonas endophytica]
MRMLTALSAFIALAVAAPLVAGEPRPLRRFELVNAAHDSVVSLAVATAGGGEFVDVALGPPLRGGGRAITVELPDGGCRRDFRIVFRGGRSVLYRDVDVCRHWRLRLTPRDGKSR